MSAKKTRSPAKARARKNIARRISGALLQPVKIILTVTKFIDVLTTTADANQRNTAHTMRLEAAHSRARKVKISDWPQPVLKIKRGGATYRFEIKAKHPKHEYYPLGIAFLRRKSPVDDNDTDDVLGRKNFSFDSMHLEDKYLFISDNFKDCGVGDRYKFSVFIQRAHDGKIGIIDPPIVHEDET